MQKLNTLSSISQYTLHWEKAQSKQMTISFIPSEDQTADIFTEALTCG